ncbi:hypothetical protein ACI7YT_10180 [Microbacterium sp. M]|uniref:hypothetical protein n=1 Tax=Microbacterium sp. M TaxID=3377125 RepID=UPI00386E8A38
MTDIAEEFPPGKWMEVVGEVLPLAYRAAMPFTLREAVEELGLWAKLARAESWASSQNRRSLKTDIDALAVQAGPRLRDQLKSVLAETLEATDRSDISVVTGRFRDRWRAAESISAAFRDLCSAAAQPAVTTDQLGPYTNILASQLDEAAQSTWGPLRRAADILMGYTTPGTDEDVPPEQRLRLAEEILCAEPPSGEVTVWALYERAVSPFRLEFGDVTFLRADWVIPNAIRDDGQSFTERDELRSILDGPWWPTNLLEESLKQPSNRLVLARVHFGIRELAGATADAIRQIDAILSIAIGSGGVSWKNTGTKATLLNGELVGGTFGRIGSPPRQIDDTYGMSATSEILDSVASGLNDAMRARPLPDYLVEALLTLREAGMVDHRDVLFYDARAVTPRIAIALEDHALEHIASFGEVKPTALASAVQQREVDWQFEQHILAGLLGPLNHAERSRAAPVYRDLEFSIFHHDESGTRIVSIPKAIELRDELLAIETPPWVRNEFLDAVDAVTKPKSELQLRLLKKREVEVIRSRHRRVRNAVSHGNPLPPSTIASVQGYSSRTARSALGLALHSFATKQTIADLLTEEQAGRSEQERLLAAGCNYVNRLARLSTGRAGDSNTR